VEQSVVTNCENFHRRKRFLIGQLGKYGDCLYATTIARQIKTDYPGCHVTWAIGSIYRSILIGNPYIDEIWEFPLTSNINMAESWEKFEHLAIKRKNQGDFDEIVLTQIYPNNFKNFDGTVRPSIFRAYTKPIKVPVSPVVCLLPEEVENVRIFAEFHHLKQKNRVILFECSPNSGQSFVTMDFAIAVSKKLIEKVPDVCIILSSNESFTSPDDRIVNGSGISFRENAELTKYCTLLIGCSSGISWLCTSDWAKPLPMVQLLKRDNGVYGSFVRDYEYFDLATDLIIEMTECSEDTLSQCIHLIFTEGFDIARSKYHEKIRLSVKHYFGSVILMLLQNKKYKAAILSMKCTAKRWIFDALFA
jgi:hypothetical protein